MHKLVFGWSLHASMHYRKRQTLAEKIATKKKQSVITASLRGDDYLAPELLEQLPATTSSAAALPAEPAKKKPSRAEAKAAAIRKRPREPEQHDGLPRAMQRAETVEVAVLDSTHGGPRLHAPVQSGVRQFMDQQLFGSRHRRVPAATLSSLRPSGSARFSAASNFATAVALPPNPDIGVKRKKRKKGGDSPTKMAGMSMLERMAAQIMKKKR